MVIRVYWTFVEDLHLREDNPSLKSGRSSQDKAYMEAKEQDNIWTWRIVYQTCSRPCWAAVLLRDC